MKKPSLNIKSIGPKLKKLTKKLSKYTTFIFVLVVLFAYGFIVFRIRTLTGNEPDSAIVADRLKTLQRPQVDKPTLDKIKKLQDTNVQVKVLFDQARDNPFQD